MLIAVFPSEADHFENVLLYVTGCVNVQFKVKGIEALCNSEAQIAWEKPTSSTYTGIWGKRYVQHWSRMARCSSVTLLQRRDPR